MLIVIDQFEELFTLSQRRAQERFLETLAAVVDPAASRVRAVMAMRADFYGACATFPWLASRVTANQVLVGPMSLADLKKVIEQPAPARGFASRRAWPTPCSRMPVANPPRSRSCRTRWPRPGGAGTDETLTLAGYREAGGVAGSISQTADSLYESVFDEAEKEACRRLMLRLVTPGEGTSDSRRRLPRDELDRDPSPEVSSWVVDRMVDARLLTVDRDSLEIAHEALLRSWPRLRNWIDEARDDLRTRQRIDVPRRSGSRRIAIPISCIGEHRSSPHSSGPPCTATPSGPPKRDSSPASEEALGRRRREPRRRRGARVGSDGSRSRSWRCSPSRRSEPR